MRRRPTSLQRRGDVRLSKPSGGGFSDDGFDQLAFESSRSVTLTANGGNFTCFEQHFEFPQTFADIAERIGSDDHWCAGMQKTGMHLVLQRKSHQRASLGSQTAEYQVLAEIILAAAG